jgi:Tfp pilus assembly pilus retraction ATPase PilT
MDFNAIFKTLVEQQASDLYLKGGTKPAIRGLGPVVAVMSTGRRMTVRSPTAASPPTNGWSSTLAPCRAR